MTAEIAIMNKLGVALAADSAATIGYQSGNKIYNSANKLFMLSAIHPVGIMIYGAAELAGVPWETIVKLYRTHIGIQKFNTLQEYVADFISFLEESQTELFPDSIQQAYLTMAITQYFRLIREEIHQNLQASKTKNSDDVLKIWVSVIGSHKNNFDKLELLAHIDAEYLAQVEKSINDIFEGIFNNVFGDAKLPIKTVNELKTIGIRLIVKDIFSSGSSGVVFAGYGEKGIFPAVIPTQTESFFVSRLKHKTEEITAISFESSAAIVPFAQSEMVAAFMEGINPDYKQFVTSYVSNLLDNYRESLVNNLPGFEEKEKSNLSDVLAKIGIKLIEDFNQEIRNYEYKTYSKPIIDNVQFLPIDELASMAEALVNLTSFKRHISPDSETVGGPIDVAVISKKDGFIWIKRKHYFRAELNQHFFAQHDRYLSDNQE